MFGFEEVVTLISTVGFPIFVAVWLLYFSKKQKERLDEALNDLRFEVSLLREMVKHKLDVDDRVRSILAEEKARKGE